jgi:hypothetical protein
MIELERDASQDIQVWADADFSHVIVQETEDTYRYGSGGPGWYVRDENGETGPFNTFEQALYAADDRWIMVSLYPANRLREEVESGRPDEIGQFLLEYLAEYGPVGIDAQDLAQRVFERIEQDA